MRKRSCNYSKQASTVIRNIRVVVTVWKFTNKWLWKPIGMEHTDGLLIRLFISNFFFNGSLEQSECELFLFLFFFVCLPDDRCSFRFRSVSFEKGPDFFYQNTDTHKAHARTLINNDLNGHFSRWQCLNFENSSWEHFQEISNFVFAEWKRKEEKRSACSRCVYIWFVVVCVWILQRTVCPLKNELSDA